MSDEKQKQSYEGDITDDDAIAWLERNYPSKPTEPSHTSRDTVRETLWRRS